MWIYEKKLEYPVKIKKSNPALAKIIIAQYGGPDGELGAALRYLSQRFTMVTPHAKATLNDVGIYVLKLYTSLSCKIPLTHNQHESYNRYSRIT